MGITSNLSFLLIDYFTIDTDSAPVGAFQYLQTKTAPGIGQGREIRGTTLIYAPRGASHCVLNADPRPGHPGNARERRVQPLGARASTLPSRLRAALWT